MAYSSTYPSLLLVICSLWIAREAYRLGVGNLSSPGPGFMVFGAAALLGLLALHLSIKSFLKGRKDDVRPQTKGHRGRVGSVFVSLVFYVFLFQPLGYLLATFFLLLFLFRSPRPGMAKWFIVTGSAAFTSLLTYWVFCGLFALPFPRGVLHFY
jgi:hypothetical protein